MLRARTENRQPCTALLTLIGISLLTQGAALAADSDSLPRTSWGDPDLQGIWTNATQTPLERPASYGTERAMSEAEAMDREAMAQRRQEQSNRPSDPDRPPPQDGNTAAAYNSFWLDRGVTVAHIDGEYRTSMIIEPEDGQIPYREDRPLSLMHQWRGDNPDEFAGPEQATIGERCLLFYDFRTSNSSVGPPMMPMIYNNLYQIVQTPEYVVIMAEMMHDARIIRLDDEHQPDAMHKWMGDSVGHWEGDTLVIETRNLHPQQSHFGSSSDLVVTEELTRASDGQINYRFTMRDPDVYTQAWTAEMPFRARPEERIYEYACHEGNYALPGILAGARREEQDAASEQD